MKAIFLLLTVSLSSLAALMNLQRLTAVKDQVIAALPKVEASVPSTPGPLEVPVAGSPVHSVDDVVREYGEPQRTERSANGTAVYYYPYYIIYIQNGAVVGRRSVATQPPAAPNTTGQRFWGANRSSTAVNITATGISPATTKTGWQAQTNSLGSASLNGSGSAVTRPSNGAWQGAQSSAPTVSAPRAAVVRPSTGAAMYRSTGSTGSSQWH